MCCLFGLVWLGLVCVAFQVCKAKGIKISQLPFQLVWAEVRKQNDWHKNIKASAFGENRIKHEWVE